MNCLWLTAINFFFSPSPHNKKSHGVKLGLRANHWCRPHHPIHLSGKISSSHSLKISAQFGVAPSYMKSISLELFQANTSGNINVCTLSCQPLRQIQQLFNELFHDQFLNGLQHKISNRLHTQNFVLSTSTSEPNLLTSINLNNTASPPTSQTFLGWSTSNI